jgi:Thioredoxin
MGTGKKIDKAYFTEGMNYAEYKELINELLAEEKTTGEEQSEELLEMTRLNIGRMMRIDKTINMQAASKEAAAAIKKPQVWLILTEAWCGDAAQTIGVMRAFAKLNGLIEMRFLLRDEHPELMDQYLTDGKNRSIPKLIAVDKASGEELFNWGPRPASLQKQFKDMQSSGVEAEDSEETIHQWYAKDKTESTQEELAELITESVS